MKQTQTIFDYTLLVNRVLEDTNYIDKASEFEKQVANKIVDQNNGVSGDYNNLPIEHGQEVASVFKGMTLKQFNHYIQNLKNLLCQVIMAWRRMVQTNMRSG